MLCSVKSNSNWLHRLRTSRGFPSDDDHSAPGLADPAAPSPISPIPTESKNPASIPAESDPPPNQNPDLSLLITNVLSELFNFGGGATRRPSKVPRKQPNPRTCAVSAAASVGDSCAAVAGGGGGNGNHVRAMSPSSAENSVAAGGRELRRDGAEEEILWMGGEDWEVGTFSRTMVTVIDTSAPVWRSEKVVLRKGDVWKVCDRKGNSSNASRKRRRANATGKEDKVLLLNQGETLKNNNKECIEEAEGKRLLFARPLNKPATGDSSILHIKCIATGSKKDCAPPKRRHKDSC